MFILSPENNFEMIVKDHSERNIGKKVMQLTFRQYVVGKLFMKPSQKILFLI